MTGSSGRDEPQFFLDRCERVAVTGDTMNCVSHSTATANPITSANTGEGMVCPHSGQMESRPRWQCETARRQGVKASWGWT